MMRTIEEKLVEELKTKEMKPRDMLLVLGLPFTKKNIDKLTSLLSEIKKIYPLKEKIPGCYYIKNGHKRIKGE